jgi:hypothetical protein
MKTVPSTARHNPSLAKPLQLADGQTSATCDTLPNTSLSHIGCTNQRRTLSQIIALCWLYYHVTKSVSALRSQGIDREDCSELKKRRSEVIRFRKDRFGINVISLQYRRCFCLENKENNSRGVVHRGRTVDPGLTRETEVCQR